MRTIEEQIWDYIDGGCDAAERIEIAAKIDSDPIYRSTYEELSQVHEMIASEPLNEPSMSFTRNVMEKVQLEVAPVSLKTKVDSKIIYSISGFFLLSILAIFIYAIVNSSTSVPEFNLPEMHIDIDVTRYVTPLSVKVFLFVDLILALMYFDRLLRRKIMPQ
jgi:hypothetical protein